MKVLAIGNSFSQDATRYLHGVAKADGTDLKVVNLYIGGCPLSHHYANAIDDKKVYSLEFNGETTGFMVSIKEALLSESWDNWDVVTIQQQSSRSADYKTFQPYLDFMKDYILKYSPQSKLYLHQTWGYTEQGSRDQGYKGHTDMFEHIKDSYENARKDISAEKIIPSGEYMNNLMCSGMEGVHRDAIHAGLGAGRYGMALLWYNVLTGKPIDDIDFKEFDVPVTDEEIKLVKQAVKDAASKYNK